MISSSPERYVSLSSGRVAESRPIKGTRPRGDTPQEDARIRRELAASVKDRAENVMIVDLVRNDLGRVCKFGTVQVPELMLVEPYATVFQMVSTVRGELADGTRVNGVVELRHALMSRPGMLASAFTEKMMVYALGRGVDFRDMPEVRAIVSKAAAGNYRFRDVVMGIVESRPFRMKPAREAGAIAGKL